MRDINFFSPYQEGKRKNKKTTVVSVLAALLIVGSAGGSYYLFETQKTNLKNEIASYDEIINKEENKRILKEAEIKKKILESMKEYSNQIDLFVEKKLTGFDYISSELISNLSLNMPMDMNFTIISIENSVIKIQGTSSSRESVAEFVRNIKESPIFEKQYVFEISDTSEQELEGVYTFTMEFKIRGAKSEVK